MADWESIVREHGPMAFDTAMRLLGNAEDTEDVVQEALLEAFRLHRRERIENWGGLLRHLATRRAIDRLRKRAPGCQLTGAHDEGPPTAPQTASPESIAIERELAERLRAAVALLPDREASVFSLHYFGGMTNREIGETLAIRPQTVGVALHRARAKLKESLGLSEASLKESNS